jgi:hypothetical protein
MVRAPSLAQLIDRGFLFARLVCAFRRCTADGGRRLVRRRVAGLTGEIRVGGNRVRRVDADTTASGFLSLPSLAITRLFLVLSEEKEMRNA